MSHQLKVALVHDDFLQAGGAENLFATIAQVFPDAPIYTSLVDPKNLPPSCDPQRVKTSFMQKIPFAKYFYKALLPIYPLAFESFNFQDFNLVISSTTRFAKGIITGPKTVHISYLNSTPRFLWESDAQKNYLPGAIRFLLKPLFGWLKKWDIASSARVDFYLANSQNVAKKIKKIYGQDAQVVYPYVNTTYFTPAKIHNWQLKSQKYYLIVSRLVKWKRIDVAIEAAKDLNISLFIVGDGPDKKRLKRLAQGQTNIKFLGKITKQLLRELYQNCQALIATQNEDFGIAAVEAQSCGNSTIAYGRGGIDEILIEGKTGLTFDSQAKESIKDAINRHSKLKWSVSVSRKNALRFSKTFFVKNFKKAINSYVRQQIT